MPDVVIHSNIASSGNWREVRSHDSIKLWYFARGVDSSGCGKAEFSLDEAARLLQKSRNTIRSYLVKGKKIGVFRHYSIEAGLCKVFYSSRNHIGEMLGLKSLGISVRLRLEQLQDIRFHLIDGVTKAATHWAMRTAKATVNKASIQKTVNAVQSSLDRQGAIGQRRIVFLNSSHQSYATSQAKIGEVLNLSLRTINRNLSWFERFKAGLDEIPRVQLAIHAPEYSAAFLGKDTEVISALNLIHPPGSSRTYRLYPCIYRSNAEVVNTRWQARKYKKFLSAKCRQNQVAGGIDYHLKNLSMQEKIVACGKVPGGDTM